MTRAVLALAVFLSAIDAATAQQGTAQQSGRPAANFFQAAAHWDRSDRRQGDDRHKHAASTGDRLGGWCNSESARDDNRRSGPVHSARSRARSRGTQRVASGTSRASSPVAPVRQGEVMRSPTGRRSTSRFRSPRRAPIVGRVFDEYGEPVTCRSSHRAAPTMVRHRPYLEAVGDGDFTDDTGAFRLTACRPGNIRRPPAHGLRRGSVVQTTLAPTYYPGTATRIRTRGSRRSGGQTAIDFPLLPFAPRVSAVRLHVERQPANAFLSLTSRRG
jgi:hypothetical protein